MVISANLEAHASAADCSQRYPHLRQGRKGATLPCGALPHELAQGQRGTLVVGHPAEQHVQDAQDRRKVGLVRHRQVEATFVEEADINPLRGARGIEFVIQLDALVGWAQVPEA